MNVPEPGFHPLQRVVSRLAKISPHRQVQLLCLISVVTVAIIVGSVFGALAPTHRSLQNSTERLVPAMEKLDNARASYNATSAALQQIVDPSTRAGAITLLTSLNSAGESAWTAYLRISAHLPGERALQQAFVQARQAALVAGSAFVIQPSPSAAALSDVTQRADDIRAVLNRIKELYEGRVQHSLSAAADEVARTERDIMIVSGIAFVIMLLAFGVASRSARSREQRLRALDHTLHEDAERNALEATMQRSLEMAHTEPAAYTLVGHALGESAPGISAELLVADSSRAHFHQAATSDAGGGPGCPVMSPNDCPAATWGQTQTWTSRRGARRVPVPAGPAGR